MNKLSALCLIASGAIGGLFFACTPTTDTGTDPVVDMTVRSFAIGGSVTTLTGSGLVLSLNGTEDLPISAAGQFTFKGKVATGSPYNVTVKSSPPYHRPDRRSPQARVGGADTGLWFSLVGD